MKKALYIGQCNPGSTSRIRFEVLRNEVCGDIQLMDISDQINDTHRFFRTLGWRFFVGPLLWKINFRIKKILISEPFNFDFIWIDKGVFIYPWILKQLKKRTKYLIHYTPDTAFYENHSFHFFRGISFYDFLITTKSFELYAYQNLVSRDKVFLLSQGYNSKVHYSRNSFKDKLNKITFIGLHEPYREKVLSFLLNKGHHIILGGIGWNQFLLKHAQYSDQLTFIGQTVLNDQYALAISESKFALGLLSKKFPELHTTRTFEIPACGTCLITEENDEIDSFFTNEECLKYKSLNELANKITYLLENPNALQKITEKGSKRVRQDFRDYESQIRNFTSEHLF